MKLKSFEIDTKLCRPDTSDLVNSGEPVVKEGVSCFGNSKSKLGKAVVKEKSVENDIMGGQIRDPIPCIAPISGDDIAQANGETRSEVTLVKQVIHPEPSKSPERDFKVERGEDIFTEGVIDHLIDPIVMSDDQGYFKDVASSHNFDNATVLESDRPGLKSSRDEGNGKIDRNLVKVGGEDHCGGQVEESKTTQNVDDFHIVINRAAAAVTVRAPLQVMGQNVKAVIDTGAEVTVLSENLYRSLPDDVRPPLRKTNRGLVLAESDNVMKTHGVADVQLQIGSQQFRWSVFVAPIGDEMLLGCDIIDEKDITLNTKCGLQLNNEWIDCDVSRKAEKKSIQVTIKRSVTIPANTEFVITAKSEGNESIGSRYGILEPVTEDKRSIIVARTLVDPGGRGIPVRILNMSNSPVKLKKGYLIGEISSIDAMLETVDIEESDQVGQEHPFCRRQKMGQSCTPADLQVKPPVIQSLFGSSESVKNGSHLGEEVNLPRVPDHLKELYEKSCTNLEDKSQKQKLAEILIKHQDAFATNKTDIGTCSLIKHQINTGGAAPDRQPLRRTPQGFEGEDLKNLEDQIESGLVVPSKSAWASPVVLVRKKDNSVRWCIDYRRLNDCTVKDAYPLPRIDMCLDCLSEAKLFSTCDLQSGYWQIEMDEKDRHKTAFITKYGLYEYTKMPFGVCNGPSTFQRCMELVFRGMQWKVLLIYLDDIIIYSSNYENHLESLDEVLKRLKNVGLKLKPSKCEFLQSELLFLGHLVGKDGIKPNPKLIESVKNWKVPKSAKEFQQFLGLANYYRQHIYKFSDIAAPLNNLTKKEVSFDWSEECQKAFEKLKQTLCEAPTLGYPKPQGRFILDTDASDVGIGATLSQIQEGKEKVIAYASKKLNKQQQRYSVTRRELLAVVTFVDQFRHYLLGREFTVRTDHSSL